MGDDFEDWMRFKVREWQIDDAVRAHFNTPGMIKWARYWDKQGCLPAIMVSAVRNQYARIRASRTTSQNTVKML